MNRRNLLKGMGAAAAASLWPGWLNEAFAGERCGVLKGAVTLSAAIQRAHAAFQPLLVFVIPKDDGAKWDRGHHFGEWLNYGSNLDLAPLACAGVVCSEMEAVRQLFPSAPKDEEPAILAVDVDRAPARIGVALPAFHHEQVIVDRFTELPGLPGPEGMSEEDRRKAYAARWDELNNLQDRRIDACIQDTATAVHAAIFGDSAAAKRRADATWDRLAASDREVARRIIAGGDGTPDQVLAVAPVLGIAASAGSGDPRLLKLLADAARARYCNQRVPGSKWAVAEGCGETVEGEEDNIAFGCGMGHVPLRSTRFLYFFTRLPYATGE